VVFRLWASSNVSDRISPRSEIGEKFAFEGENVGHASAISEASADGAGPSSRSCNWWSARF